MSDIVLSASVRQNLLSLQSTAELLATTQNRLATGKKVNTALDNPTNYFTAQSLDNRASDINNLLDGVGNGVQVLQAANTGITSLQKLVDTAKSIANQALQAAVGYSSKSSVSTLAIAGATADDLRGGAASNAVLTGTGALATLNLTGGAATNAVATGSAALAATTTAAASGSTVAAGVYAGNEFVGDGTTDDTITIDGTTIDFDGTTDGTTAIADTVTNKYTLAEAVAKINTDLTAASSTVTATVGTGADAGKIVLTNSATGTASNFSVDASGTTSTKTGGFGGSVVTTTSGANATGGIDASGGAKAFTITLDGGTPTTVTLATNGGTNADGHYSANDIKTAINTALTGAGVTTLAATVDGTNHLVLTSTSATQGTGDTIAVADVTSSGLTAAFGLAASTAGSAATDRTFNVNGQTVTLAGGASYSATQIRDAINTQVGTSASVAATIDGTGHLVLTSTGTAGSSDAVTVGTFSTGDASQLGYAAAASATASGLANAGGLDTLILTIGATGTNGVASSVTFGDGTAGTVKSLNDLNAKLASNNLFATIDTTGKITITTTNDAASAQIGVLGGSAAAAGKPFNGLTISGPVVDAAAQLVRSNLVSQYNNILDQITTTAQDASYNGINLVNGDQLKLTFNETGTSTLNIQGVTFSSGGLGLSKLTSGTDFLDNASANTAIARLDKASGALRTEASALGSNLSIVQIRQDFSKNLINVLQTGSSNLTLADTNEEAANSQALSTRQSIAVSALALANQSQQSVLQLLR